MDPDVSSALTVDATVLSVLAEAKISPNSRFSGVAARMTSLFRTKSAHRRKQQWMIAPPFRSTTPSGIEALPFKPSGRCEGTALLFEASMRPAQRYRI